MARFDRVGQGRCAYALRAGTNLMTRCGLQPGHSGPHVGKGLKKFPYQRIEWFAGDGREFVTEATHEWAWSSRKKGAGNGE